MTELLTQARLVEIEQRRRIDAALGDSTRPKAHGLDKIADLERKAARAQAEATAERARLADAQREIDLKFRSLENLRKRRDYATQQVEYFKDAHAGQLAKREGLIGTDALSVPLAIHLQTEIDALANIIAAFPPAIKGMESDIKRLSKELDPFISKGGENEG